MRARQARDALAGVLAVIGDAVRRAARYRAAEAFLGAAVVAAPSEDLPGHRRLVCLNLLGLAYKDAGRYAPADRCYRAALAGLEQTTDGSPLAVAAVHHNLAGLAHAQGRWDDGLPHAMTAIRLRTGVLGEHHPDVAADRGVLGALLIGQGRTQEAVAVLRRVLEVMETVHGADHLEVAVVLNNLASALQFTAPAEAEECYRRALRIKERRLGSSHPDVAVVFNNLGVLYRRQGRHAESVACLQRALPVLSTRLGHNHPTTGACRTNLDQSRRRAAVRPPAEDLSRRGGGGPPDIRQPPRPRRRVLRLSAAPSPWPSLLRHHRPGSEG